MPDRQGDEVVDTVGCERGDRPCQRRTPVVADHVRSFDAQLIEHAEHVAGNERDGVGLDLGGAIGLSETTQIGNDAAVAGRGECGHRWRHNRCESGQPWSSSTGGPVPSSCTSIPTPFTS